MRKNKKRRRKKKRRKKNKRRKGQKIRGKINEKRQERKARCVKETQNATESTSSPIIKTEFERLEKKTQENIEKVKFGLLKIKAKAQGIKP